eukprot:gb/GEZN01009509.1/.p1 GENE.gb/GEZN01009509.1/~~gb/GEZN01009509.1/.p1  ORF type:complete len:164 (-),score=13.27 gb/GEZN01009509.1/:795-1286(-)
MSATPLEEVDPWKPSFVPEEVAKDQNIYSCGGCGLLGTSHGLNGTALMLRCTGCRAARYCCAKCQNEDWAVGGHRVLCNEARLRRENLSEEDDCSMFLTPRRLQRRECASSNNAGKQANVIFRTSPAGASKSHENRSIRTTGKKSNRKPKLRKEQPRKSFVPS